LEKIVFLDRKTLGDDVCLDAFNKFGEVLTFESTSADLTLERIADATIVVTNKVVIDKNIMDQTNIKLICIAATGMNNIDLEYASQKGIEVKNVAGYSTSSVTQLTFALVLDFINKISYYDNFGKNDWQNNDVFTHLGKSFYDLDGKSWGIIGLGDIGKQVANVAQSFGCNVSFYSTSGKNSCDLYEQKSLENILKESDIVSIHAPLNEQTNNLLNKDNLALIKENAILLNLGRGGIVNEEDISKEIDSRTIYFGTDVVSKEPIVKDSPLLKIKNKEQLLLTPHIAWASKEARVRLVEGIVKNIEGFLK
jgi:lactate dehydrogenase-like 2-hydroxyacid dehydrogenase